MALVLNPADMTFVKPSDSQIIMDSTHLRVLVISNLASFQAYVQIDNGELIALSKTDANTPLYTGLHFVLSTYTGAVLGFRQDGCQIL